jgi:hypothetical protein
MGLWAPVRGMYRQKKPLGLTNMVARGRKIAQTKKKLFLYSLIEKQHRDAIHHRVVGAADDVIYE